MLASNSNSSNSLGINTVASANIPSHAPSYNSNVKELNEADALNEVPPCEKRTQERGDKTTQKIQLKRFQIHIRPLDRVREMSTRALKFICFPRNKYITVEELEEWMKTKTVLDMDTLYLNRRTMTVDNSFFLIDARREDEYKYSHLKNAINMPSMLPSEQFIKYVNKETPIVVYCAVGVRSGILTRRLNKLGFKNARTLLGSMYKWVNTGRPLYTSSGTSITTVIPQHWLASLLLDPSKVGKIKLKHPQHGAIYANVIAPCRRVLVGTRTALSNTIIYHRKLKRQAKKKEAKRLHLVRLFVGKK
jgi:rhodanese-related sulfurtransferase